MKRRSLNLVVLAILPLSFFIQCCCTPNASIGSVAVALHPQQTNMWCWAASGQMCMSFLGATVDITQCTQANNRFGKTNCCNSPTPSPCVNGGWPEFDKYGFSSNMTTDAALSWADVKKQIYCYHKPIAFSWHWTGGGGHMMVITGYAVVNGQNMVFINDPWAPNVGGQYAITYDDYVAGSGHTHWNDYYNITKK